MFQSGVELGTKEDISRNKRERGEERREMEQGETERSGIDTELQRSKSNPNASASETDVFTSKNKWMKQWNQEERNENHRRRKEKKKKFNNNEAKYVEKYVYNCVFIRPATLQRFPMTSFVFNLSFNLLFFPYSCPPFLRCATAEKCEQCRKQHVRFRDKV